MTDWCNLKKRKFRDTHRHTRFGWRGMANVNHKEKRTTCKPRGEAWSISFSHGLQKESILPDLRLLSSRTVRK